MRLLILLFVPLIASASPETRRLEKMAADKVRDWIYTHEETEKFCTENPDQVFVFMYKDNEIRVDCEVRNKWLVLTAKN